MTANHLVDQAEKFGHLPVYRDLESDHAAVHAQARQIAQLYAEGRRCEASEQFPHLHEASLRLCSKLDRLAAAPAAEAALC